VFDTPLLTHETTLGNALFSPSIGAIIRFARAGLGVNMGDLIRETISTWRDRVKGNTLPPVSLLCSDSDTFVRTAVDILVNHAFRKGDKGLNFHVVDGKSTGPAGWLMTARTAPMLASRRVVQVSDADQWLRRDTAKSNPEEIEALTAFATGGGKARGSIVLVARTVEAGSPVTKTLDELNAVFRFKLQAKGGSIQTFIRDLFKKRGIMVDAGAVSYLADALGTSTDAIVTEVEKLTEYGREVGLVTVDDAKEMVGRLRGHQFYEFSQAVAQRNGAVALTVLDRMYNNLVEARKKVSAAGLPLILLSFLEGEFWSMAVAKGFTDSRDIGELSRRLALRRAKAGKKAPAPVSEFVAKKMLGNARKFSTGEIAAALSGIREVDKRLKSTRLPSRVLLEELVVSICAKKRRKAGGAK